MNHKLMIVDDSNIVRRSIERAVNLDNLDIVGVAGNGLEAIEIFKKEAPDLVTMDITMPEMDGVRCVKELCEINPDVHILVISALADKATAIEALSNGAQGFLRKPFNQEELNAAFLELLEDD
jgi:two-component system chemotaxis response regulator CheY